MCQGFRPTTILQMEAESRGTSAAVTAAAVSATPPPLRDETVAAACAQHPSLHNPQKVSTLSRLSSVFLTPTERIWLTCGLDVAQT